MEDQLSSYLVLKFDLSHTYKHVSDPFILLHNKCYVPAHSDYCGRRAACNRESRSLSMTRAWHVAFTWQAKAKISYCKDHCEVSCYAGLGLHQVTCSAGARSHQVTCRAGMGLHIKKTSTRRTSEVRLWIDPLHPAVGVRVWPDGATDVLRHDSRHHRVEEENIPTASCSVADART